MSPGGQPADADIRAHVTPGGAAFVYELPGLTIRKASVGPMDNNAYLLTDRSSGQQLLIDAAADAARLSELVNEGSGRLDLLVTTHQHHDHVGALAAMVAAFGAPSAAGDADADALPVAPDRRLHHGDTIELGVTKLQVIELRGHTPGGVALAYIDPASGVVHIFTGDSLFPGGPGRTTHPDDFTQLMDDLESKIFNVYGDDTAIYPGHGLPTTLGVERPHLTAWRDRGW